MKLKISFDKKSILNFFLYHTEKVVFALFILVFASIIYGAVMRREKFDKVPAQLIEKCSTAKQSLQGERPELVTPLNKTRDYNKDADIYLEIIKNGISEKGYQCNVAWNAPIFGIKSKRSQPKLLEVEELRTAAEFGAFSVSQAPAAAAAPERAERGVRPGDRGRGDARGGASTVQGKCWVVITGLVPVETQAAEFRSAFRDATGYDPTRDIPTYLSYIVQRIQVTSQADLSNPDWKKAVTFTSKEVAEEVAKNWATLPTDVVDPKYIDQNLAFPLGPLTKRSWGKNVAHDPEIPVVNAGDPTAVFRDRRDDRTRRDPRTAGQETAGVVEGEALPKYKLFRFFDFTVEPGESYIYRVKLVLNNPNYDLPTSQVDQSLAKTEKIETEFSKQSSAVYVPTDTRILVDSVKPKGVGDFSGKVYLLKWVKETGHEAYKDFPNFDRGQLHNYKDVEVKPVPDPDTGFNTQPSMDSTNLNTDATVLDMDGGKKLPGRDRNLVEPAEMLFMIVRGKSVTLMLRNQMDDLTEVKRVSAEPADPAGGADRRPPPNRRGAGERMLLEEPDPRRDPRTDPRTDPRAADPRATPDPRRNPPPPPPTRTR